MATKVCPHDCSRCRAIEAGVSGPFTPQQFTELFDLVEPAGRNGTPPELASAIGDAEAAAEAAQAGFDQAHREVGLLVARLARGHEQGLEEALAVAAEERRDAGELLVAARQRHRQLVRSDSERRQFEEYEAGRAAQADARRESDRQRRRLGETVLAKLRKGSRS